MADTPEGDRFRYGPGYGQASLPATGEDTARAPSPGAHKSPLPYVPTGGSADNLAQCHFYDNTNAFFIRPPYSGTVHIGAAGIIPADMTA